MKTAKSFDTTGQEKMFRASGLIAQPVLSDVGVIALVPDYWEPQWQPRHQVMTRLARYFHVLWVDYPPRWRDALSVMHSRRAATREFPPTPANFEVYEPEFWLPRLGRPDWLARLTSRERLKRAANRLRARGCTRLVLYIWRPEFADAINETSCDLSVYHIDDEYSFSATETELSAVEREPAGDGWTGLYPFASPAAKKGKFNPNTEFVPNGVDYALYATPVSEPEISEISPGLASDTWAGSSACWTGICCLSWPSRIRNIHSFSLGRGAASCHRWRTQANG